MNIATQQALSSGDTPERQERLRRTARSRFRNTDHMASLPNEVREFAPTFNNLQGERHTADHNPGPTFTGSGTLRTIDQARQAIIRFAEAPPKIRHYLTT